MSAPQDQTSYSPTSQWQNMSFKLIRFLRRLLLFYHNPSSSSTSLLGTSQFLIHSFSPLGWCLPAIKASKRTYSEWPWRTTCLDWIVHLCVWLCQWMCIKKGRDIFFLFFGGEERVNKLQRYLINFLLGQHHPISICECLDAHVLFIFLYS